MDYLKLAQRTISMLNSMIESGECHTERTREMAKNAQRGLEQLRQSNIDERGELMHCPCCGSDNTYKTDAIHCNRCAVTTEV